MANNPDEAPPIKRTDSAPLEEKGATGGSSPQAGSSPSTEPFGLNEPAKAEIASASDASPTPSIIPVIKPAEGVVARSHEATSAVDPTTADTTHPAVSSAPEAEPGISGSTIHDAPDTHGHEEWQGDSSSHGEDPYHHHEEYQPHHGYHEEGVYDVASTVVMDSGGGRGSDGGHGPSGEEPEEGGPIKSFLDHLEDLRWMLIKCASATGIAMLLCLIVGNRITNDVLMHPLRESERIEARWLKTTNQMVTVQFGTNLFGPYHMQPELLKSLPFTNATYVTLEVKMTLMDTNYVLTAVPRTNTIDEMPLNQQLIQLNPVGGFVVAFQVAIYGGILLASPFLFYFIAQFVFPALKIKERKFITRGIAIGTILFLTGVLFCYFVLMPFALHASVKYSEWLGFSASQWRAEEYISFVCKFMLGMGLGFELPVVILTLVKMGVLSYSSLVKLRPYMIVINLVLGAVLTTPEVLTQVLMAVPLQILYEASVLIAWYWERKERKRKEAEAAAGR